MKKIIGWLLLIVNGLLFLVTLFFILISLNQPIKDIINSIPQYGFILILHIVFLYIGLLFLKKKKQRTLIPYDKNLDMHLQGTIKLSQYRHTAVSLRVIRPLYFFYAAVAILFIVLYKIQEMSIEWVITYVLIVVLIPISTWIRAGRLYKNLSFMHDPVSYHLTNETIYSKGTQTETTKQWSYFKQIRETNYFFLLYESSEAATFLSKDLFTDAQKTEFRSFLRSLPIDNISLQDKV